VSLFSPLNLCVDVLFSVLTQARSQVSDGVSSVILARRSWAEARGLKPIGRFVGTQVSGCEPDEMGVGPALAIPAR
jgi:acetyl-CoA acetyltransferase